MSDENKKILKGLTKRLDGIDGRIDGMDRRIDSLGRVATDHTKRLKRLEATVATKSDVKSIMGLLDSIVARFDRFEQEFIMTTHRTTDLDDRVGILEEDVNKKIKPALSLS